MRTLRNDPTARYRSFLTLPITSCIIEIWNFCNSIEKDIMQTVVQPQEAWVKVLSKGVITIPKEMRLQLGLEEGDVAKAKVVGDKLVIASRKTAQYEELRLYSKEQIDSFVKEDQLPKPLARKVAKRWSDLA